MRRIAHGIDNDVAIVSAAVPTSDASRSRTPQGLPRVGSPRRL